jgi:murein DD-endopeptidase MepM/ murein hydrolase activator NlpD
MLMMMFSIRKYRIDKALVTALTAVMLVSCGTSDTPAPYVHYGVDGGADSAGVHTVESGDTLWSIANRYKLSMQDIIYVNKLRAPYVLDVTQRLTLPPPNTYTVRADDNLYRISRTFNVSMTELSRLNNMSAPYTIHKGEVLRLPSRRPSGDVYRTTDSSDEPLSVRRPGAKPTPKAVQRKINARVPKRSGGKFGWPVQDGRVVSSFGPKEGGLHNEGINISAPRGTSVGAAENGVVVYADNQLQGYGNLVLVKHEDRWMTAYAHLDKMSVSKGDVVKRGQHIGAVGSTGNVDAPQLHFEVRRGTSALNPVKYLGK